jgi:hypothetical protein
MLLKGSKSDGVEFIVIFGAESVAMDGTVGSGRADVDAPVGSAYPFSLEPTTWNAVEDASSEDEAGNKRLIGVTMEVPVVEAVTLG